MGKARKESFKAGYLFFGQFMQRVAVFTEARLQARDDLVAFVRKFTEPMREFSQRAAIFPSLAQMMTALTPERRIS